MINVFTMDSETFRKAYAAREASEPPSPQLTLDTALVLRRIIVRRCDEYSTSLADDAALLQDSALQGRRRMAIEVRLGEKEILASTLNAVEDKIQLLSLKEPSHEAINGDVGSARNKKRKM